MGDSAVWLSTTFSPPPEPPVPVAAYVKAATKYAWLVFGTPLRSGVSDQGNYIWRLNLTGTATTYTYPADPVVQGRIVAGTLVAGGIAFPPLGVNYNASVPDLYGRTGSPVAAFNDFPVTVL